VCPILFIGMTQGSLALSFHEVVCILRSFPPAPGKHMGGPCLSLTVRLQNKGVWVHAPYIAMCPVAVCSRVLALFYLLIQLTNTGQQVLLQTACSINASFNEFATSGQGGRKFQIDLGGVCIGLVGLTVPVATAPPRPVKPQKSALGARACGSAARWCVLPDLRVLPVRVVLWSLSGCHVGPFSFRFHALAIVPTYPRPLGLGRPHRHKQRTTSSTPVHHSPYSRSLSPSSNLLPNPLHLLLITPPNPGHRGVK
jgi:hypothetical protein